MCEFPHQRYINFYTDFAFKKLFGSEVNKELLISFLNALFDGREVVKDLQYLNVEHLGMVESDRRAVFDVYCENELGEKFIVEMQNGSQQFFRDRSVYYSTFAIQEQAKKGDWNYRLKAVYTIGILNFTFEERNEAYRQEVKLMNTCTKEVFYDKLTYIFIEMPKFDKGPDELVTLFDKWLYAIKCMAELDDRPVQLREAIFRRLFEVAEVAHLNPKEIKSYNASLKNFRDWYSTVETAEVKGREEGIEIGMEKGKEIGREEGKIEKSLEIARNLYAMGLDEAAIAAATGLTVEELRRRTDATES
jgi:predicted transposase/invertase (TIGR01784 family)